MTLWLNSGIITERFERTKSSERSWPVVVCSKSLLRVDMRWLWLFLSLLFLVLLSPLFSFLLSHRFVFSTSHAQCNHHSGIDWRSNKAFAYTELKFQRTRGSERGRSVVCSKCILFEGRLEVKGRNSAIMIRQDQNLIFNIDRNICLFNATAHRMCAISQFYRSVSSSFEDSFSLTKAYSDLQNWRSLLTVLHRQHLKTFHQLYSAISFRVQVPNNELVSRVST